MGMSKIRQLVHAMHVRIAKAYGDSWRFRIVFLIGVVSLNQANIWLISLVIGTGYWWPALWLVSMGAIAWAAACITTPPIEYYDKGGW